MQALHTIATILVIVGGLNWGFVGLFDLDLVAMLFGNMTTLSRLVYVLVGLAALTLIATSLNMRKTYVSTLKNA